MDRWAPVAPPGTAANTYLFMVQARGLMLKENVRTIGQMIRLYTHTNATANGTAPTLARADQSPTGPAASRGPPALAPPPRPARDAGVSHGPCMGQETDETDNMDSFSTDSVTVALKQSVEQHVTPPVTPDSPGRDAFNSFFCRNV
ncbi:hypothetical protein MC885_001936 [Smutsia gigantea]|nr:hypothetical protein MC885_001936 [Smutsia gigantea]